LQLLPPRPAALPQERIEAAEIDAGVGEPAEQHQDRHDRGQRAEDDVHA
jgi:hypothetical protein